MNELTTEQRRALRAAAHPLNPVVSIAQKGLTPAVLAEIDRCLKTHELIKVKLHGTSATNVPPCRSKSAPRSQVQGGKATWENIVTACLSCNNRKGGRTPQEARMRLVRHPAKP